MSRAVERNNVRRGVPANLVSSFLFALMAVTVSWGNQRFSSMDALLARSLIIVLALLPFIRKRQVGEALKDRATWIRIIAGCASIVCYFFNLHLSAPALATAFLDSGAAVGIAVTSYLNREKLRSIGWVGCTTLIIGMFLLPLISHSDGRLPGLIVGVFGAVCGGASYAALHRVAKRYSVVTIALLVACGTAVLAACLGGRVRLHEQPIIYGALALIGVYALVAQLCLTYSFRALRSTTACALITLTPIWALAIQVVRLGYESLATWDVFRALLIACGTALVTLQPVEWGKKNVQGRAVSRAVDPML